MKNALDLDRSRGVRPVAGGPSTEGRAEVDEAGSQSREGSGKRRNSTCLRRTSHGDFSQFAGHQHAPSNINRPESVRLPYGGAPWLTPSLSNAPCRLL